MLTAWPPEATRLKRARPDRIVKLQVGAPQWQRSSYRFDFGSSTTVRSRNLVTS